MKYQELIFFVAVVTSVAQAQETPLRDGWDGSALNRNFVSARGGATERAGKETDPTIALFSGDRVTCL